MTDPKSVRGLSLQDALIPRHRKAMHGETMVLLVRNDKEKEVERKSWTIEVGRPAGQKSKERKRRSALSLLRNHVWGVITLGLCSTPLS